jgi:hypothetical protein
MVSGALGKISRLFPPLMGHSLKIWGTAIGNVQ